jgi:hypothetical protein
VSALSPAAAQPALNVISLTGGGLIFRQNDEGYYALVVFPAKGLQSGFLSVMRIERLKTVELDRWPLIRTAGPIHRIEARCRETECEIYQEGTLRGRIKDKTFSEGRLGLYLTGKGDATFDDLSVEEIRQ